MLKLSQMNISKKYTLFLGVIFLLVFSFLPAVLLAQDTTPCVPSDTTPCPTQTSTSTRLKNPLGDMGTPDIPALIDKILAGALKIGVPIIALMLIYAGFLFVFSQGNKEKLSKAKTVLLYTIIGAAIFLGAEAIAKLIVETIKGL